MVSVTDTFQSNLDKKEKELQEKREKIEDQNKIDSISLDKFLKDAIKIADQKGIDRFEEKYIETMQDSSYQVEVVIHSDFYFSKLSPHLIIRRNTPGNIYIDIFSKKDKFLYKL